MFNYRIRNVIAKEWRFIMREANSMMLITIIPLIIILQVFFTMYFLMRFAGDALINTILNQGMQMYLELAPRMAAMSMNDKFWVMLLAQFPIYMLLIPSMISNSLSTISIIEEKQKGSLEPLLATPVKTRELLWGKAFANAVPALISTYACIILFFILVTATGKGHLISALPLAYWSLSIFILVPAFTALSFLLGIIASAKASTPKGAQNLALVFVLPLIALVGLQVTGIIMLNTATVALISVMMILLNVCLTLSAERMFNRENILVNWK